jgi:hypothetical protein|tara:strand:- start:3556 stop:3945 length:390 start_codon:yes stop_codon:yes gene_type:complete
MAIPSGGGSEVLRTGIQKVVSTTWLDIISVINTHIYTVLSITFCEQDGVDTHKANIRLYDGSAGYEILATEQVPKRGTFVWNDKLVLNGSDLNTETSGTNNWKLQVKNTAAANSAGLMVMCSYIDQDWT